MGRVNEREDLCLGAGRTDANGVITPEAFKIGAAGEVDGVWLAARRSYKAGGRGTAHRARGRALPVLDEDRRWFLEESDVWKYHITTGG